MVILCIICHQTYWIQTYWIAYIKESFGKVMRNPEFWSMLGSGNGRTHDGRAVLTPAPGLKKLEAIFRHKLLRILLNRGKITKEMIAMLSTWRRLRVQRLLRQPHLA
jgi:hypothetical protein